MAELELPRTWGGKLVTAIRAVNAEVETLEGGGGGSGGMPEEFGSSLTQYLEKTYDPATSMTTNSSLYLPVDSDSYGPEHFTMEEIGFGVRAVCAVKGIYTFSASAAWDDSLTFPFGLTFQFSPEDGISGMTHVLGSDGTDYGEALLGTFGVNAEESIFLSLRNKSGETISVNYLQLAIHPLLLA